MKKRRKRLHTTLLNELHRALTELSEETDIPVSRLLDRAVANFLEMNQGTLERSNLPDNNIKGYEKQKETEVLKEEERSEAKNNWEENLDQMFS